MSNWDKEVDILVVGSGAGGLLAGLVAAHNRADVLIGHFGRRHLDPGQRRRQDRGL
jgi:thioredoxin reductase